VEVISGSFRSDEVLTPRISVLDPRPVVTPADDLRVVLAGEGGLVLGGDPGATVRF
jgi:hypothetical protein